MIALLATLAFAAAPDAPRTCGTEAHLASRPAGWSSPARALPDWRDAGPKAVRDAIGSFDTYETANFAVKWGAMSGFDETDVVALGEALEAAWATQVIEQAYPAPLQTGSWKFNVYLGDTGEGTPSALGNAGYYWYDDDGYPMIVISGGDVDDRSWVALTAAHEFFHAVQDAAGVFDWGPRADWFAEASAVWMESICYPDERDTAYFLYWFAIRPELQLSFYEYPEDGNAEEYHQYGAFIFLRHLEEHVGGRQRIHDVMMGTPSGGDPLETLDALLTGEGIAYEDVFAEFVGRNATWDYLHEAWYDDLIDEFGGWSGDSHRPTGTLDGDDAEWIEVPADPPRTWGANYWRLRRFDGADVIRFDGDPDDQGDLPTAWSVQVAVQEGAEHRRIPMTLEGGLGEISATDVGTYDEAWLVVAPMHDLRSIRTWDYAVKYEQAAEPPPEEEEEEPRACGCASAPAPSGLGLWIAAAAWARRRARPRQSGDTT